MGFLFALLRRKGSHERHGEAAPRCQQLLPQSREQQAASQLHRSKEEPSVPTAAWGRVQSDGAGNGAGLSPLWQPQEGEMPFQKRSMEQLTAQIL